MSQWARWIVAVAGAAQGVAALGQCDRQWLAGDRVPGINGDTFASVLWDPPGPQGPIPVVGGQFTVAGGEFAAAVTMWDGEQWRAMGMGLGHGRSEVVHALAVMHGGELIATGSFVDSGGATVNSIARWTPSGWVGLGSGLKDGMSAFGTWGGALAVMQDGRLVAGGSFTSAGGVAANSIARWDGATWTPMGSGFAPGWVSAIAVLPNGEVVAAARVYQNNQWQFVVRKWNEAGQVWNDLGPVFGNYVRALLPLDNGQIIAGGSFVLNGVWGVAQWNGTQWAPLGAGINVSSTGIEVRSLALLPGGGIAASGSFEQAGSVPAHDVAVWQGGQWSALGSSTEFNGGSLVVLPDGRLLMNGKAVWNGQVWKNFATGGPTSMVRAVKYLPNGNLVAGGDFTEAYGVTLNHIGRRDDQGWHALGSGMNATVRAISVRDNGDIIAAGDFTEAGGQSRKRIARWNGSDWAALGAGIGDGRVHALVQMPNGDIVVGGKFASAGFWPALCVARWNGVEWSPIGEGLDAEIYALAVMPTGDLVAGGYMYDQPGKIVRWDGTRWTAMGTPQIGRVMALEATPGNVLYAGGFGGSKPGYPPTFVANRWEDGVWTPLLPTLGGMSSYVYAIKVLRSGDVLFAGSFEGSASNPIPTMAKWNGAAWASMGVEQRREVASLDESADGEIVAAGAFEDFGGNVSYNIAVYGCAPCYANCDESTVSPVLTANDFQCFLNQFAAGATKANCDGSTVTPVLTANDFQCFLNRFAAGCS